jgi:hypothetical protein
MNCVNTILKIILKILVLLRYQNKPLNTFLNDIVVKGNAKTVNERDKEDRRMFGKRYGHVLIAIFHYVLNVLRNIMNRMGITVYVT